MKKFLTAYLLFTLFATTALAQPGAPVLDQPLDSAVGVSITATLQWSAASGATGYRLYYDTDPNFSNPVDVNTLNNTSHTFGSGTLDTGKTYFWTVVASDANGSTPAADTFMFTTSGAVPVAPVLVSPGNNAPAVSGTPKLVWRKVINADNYEVIVSSDIGFQSVAFQSVTGDTSIKVNVLLSYLTKYYWRVRGINGSGNGDWSQVRTFTTQPTPPKKPFLINPANLSTTKIWETTLTWDSTTSDAEEIRIVIGSDMMLSTIVFDTLINGVITAQHLRKGILDTTTTYYWTIISIDADGFASSGDTFSFTTLITPPSRPQLVAPQSATVGAATSPQLVWKSAAGADRYEIHVSEFINFSDTAFIGTTIHPDTNITVTTKLMSETVYYWRVRGENAGGYSDWSYEYNFTTLFTGISGIGKANYGMNLYPNPSSNGKSFLAYELKEAGKVEVTLSDITGKPISRFDSVNREAGKHVVELSTGQLSTGVYIVSMQTPSGIQSLRLLVQ